MCASRGTLLRFGSAVALKDEFRTCGANEVGRVLKSSCGRQNVDGEKMKLA